MNQNKSQSSKSKETKTIRTIQKGVKRKNRNQYYTLLKRGLLVKYCTDFVQVSTDLDQCVIIEKKISIFLDHLEHINYITNLK